MTAATISTAVFARAAPAASAVRRAWIASRHLIPALLSLAVFWRVPFIWFRIDDFAWLGLSKDIHGLGDLLRALFEPQAQGTVRVLSERVLFLGLGSIFGLHAWPFRIVAFAVWTLNLALIQMVGARLTHSRAAGLLAALFWSISPVMVIPLAWASAFNQLLCMLCVLSAFYSRLRWLDSGDKRWRTLEGIAYLAGFGALEIIVVYPAIVLVHALTDPAARPYWRSAMWMYLPAGLFSIAHLFLLPRDPSEVYRLIVDARMPGNVMHYLGWAIGPSDMDALNADWQSLGIYVTIAIGVLLGAFTIYKIATRETRVVFFCAWFFLFLAPVIALPNHVSTYYLAIPGMGFAWLAGWAMVSCYRVRHPAGIAVLLVANGLALAYAVGAVAEVQALTAWHLQVTSRIRSVVRAAESVAEKHPGNTLVLQGVDDELFRAGFRDEPFRLTGVEKVVLAPGNMDELFELPEFQKAAFYKTTPEQLLPLLEASKVRVLNVASNEIIDVTAPYRIILKSEFLSAHRQVIDLGNPAFADQLGAGWYPVENRARWMGKSASVSIGGPRKAGENLFITGFAAPASLANGKLILTARLNGEEIGWAEITGPGRSYTFEFDIPDKFLNTYALNLTLETDKTFRPPGDTRDLAAVIQKIEIRKLK